MRNLEEIIRQSIKEEMNNEANKIIEQQVEQYRKKLQEVKISVISRILNELVYMESDDIASLSKNIVLSIRGR